jgi:hypothetical protein
VTGLKFLKSLIMAIILDTSSQGKLIVEKANDLELLTMNHRRDNTGGPSAERKLVERCNNWTILWALWGRGDACFNNKILLEEKEAGNGRGRGFQLVEKEKAN